MVSIHEPQRSNEDGDTGDALPALRRVFSSFFGGSVGEEPPAPFSPSGRDSSPVVAPSPSSPASPTGAASSKDLRMWVSTLPKKILGDRYSNGDELVAVVRRASLDAVDALLRSRIEMSTKEAAAVLLFTTETSIGEFARSTLQQHFSDAETACSGGSLLFPLLCDESYAFRHSVFFRPLLSALGKLPLLQHKAGALVIEGCGVAFCALELSVIKAHDDWSTQFTLPTVLNVATEFPESIPLSLGGANACRILCFKSKHIRRLGPLNLNPMKVDGGVGEECVMLPGWRGRVVGTLGMKWKRILAAHWGWDVTCYTVMEVVDDAIPLPQTSSPKKSSTNVATQPPAPAPFMAECYLVHAAKQRLAAMPVAVEGTTAAQYASWHMYLGLLLSHAKHDFDGAAREFEAVLRIRSSDNAALLQLGLLYDRHLNNATLAKQYYEAAMRSGGAAADGHICYLLGSLLRRSFADYGGARKLLEACLRLDPRHVAAHAEYGFIQEHYVNDFATAEEHYSVAIRLDPNSAEVNYVVGYSKEVTHKDYKNAKKHYTLCLASDPQHADGHFRLAKLLDEHNQMYEDARKHYENAVAFSRGNSTAAIAHQYLGFMLMMHVHDTASAYAHLTAAIKLLPSNADAHNHLGYLLWRFHPTVRSAEKRWKEAKLEFELALKYAPKHPNAHSNLGKGLLAESDAVQHGEWTGSVGEETDAARNERAALCCREGLLHLETAVQLDPADVFVRTALAEALLDHKSEEDASAAQTAKLHLEVVVAKDPCFAPARFHLARTLMATIPGVAGARLAVAQLEIALQLDPQCADAHNELGLIKETMSHDFDGARVSYERAIRINSDHIPARNNLGLILWKHFSDARGARVQFEAALRAVSPPPGQQTSEERKPPRRHRRYNEDVLKNFASLLLFEFDDYRGSRRCLEDVLRQKPDDVVCLNLLGVVLQKGFSDYRAAKHCWDHASRLAPTDTSIQNALGRLYLKDLKDSVKALEIFERVLEVDPLNDCAKTNVERILSYSKRYAHRQAQQDMMESTESPTRSKRRAGAVSKSSTALPPLVVVDAEEVRNGGAAPQSSPMHAFSGAPTLDSFI